VDNPTTLSVLLMTHLSWRAGCGASILPGPHLAVGASRDDLALVWVVGEGLEERVGEQAGAPLVSLEVPDDAAAVAGGADSFLAGRVDHDGVDWTPGRERQQGSLGQPATSRILCTSSLVALRRWWPRRLLDARRRVTAARWRDASLSIRMGRLGPSLLVSQGNARHCALLVRVGLEPATNASTQHPAVSLPPVPSMCHLWSFMLASIVWLCLPIRHTRTIPAAQQHTYVWLHAADALVAGERARHLQGPSTSGSRDHHLARSCLTSGALLMTSRCCWLCCGLQASDQHHERKTADFLAGPVPQQRMSQQPLAFMQLYSAIIGCQRALMPPLMVSKAYYSSLVSLSAAACQFQSAVCASILPGKAQRRQSASCKRQRLVWVVALAAPGHTGRCWVR